MNRHDKHWVIEVHVERRNGKFQWMRSAPLPEREADVLLASYRAGDYQAHKLELPPNEPPALKNHSPSDKPIAAHADQIPLPLPGGTASFVVRVLSKIR